MSRLPKLLAALALLHGLIYAFLIPPWQAPDEIAHFEYAHLLARYGRPLTYDDASPALERQIIDSLYTFQAWTYLNQVTPAEVPVRLADVPFFGSSRTLDRFSLAYVPYALAGWPFLGQAVAFQLYVMRLVSVLIGALVVALTYKTASLVEPGSAALAVGAALFALLLPQHAYILATINDGNLAELLASATIYLLVKTLQIGLNWQRLALTVLSAVAAILSKATAYFLVPLGIVVGLVIALLLVSVRPAAARMAETAPRVTGGACARGALLPALRLARWPTLSPQHVYVLGTIADNLHQQGGYLAYLFRIAANGSLWHAIWVTFTSFWATFGWMIKPLPGPWYDLIVAACALSVLGWALRLWVRPHSGGSRSNYAFLGLAALLPVAVVLFFLILSSQTRL